VPEIDETMWKCEQTEMKRHCGETMMGMISLTRTVAADATWNTFIRTTLEANQVSFTLVIL
jgi:hypothetical protein